MSQRECDKCGEMVDEAKAFCPGCGRAFVDENVRESSSDFNKLDGTLQLGNTMYNQMLSDMGLNISAPQDKPAGTLHPVQPAARPVQQQQVLRPAVQEVIKPAVQPETPKPKQSNTWLIVGGIVILLLVLLIAAIVIGFLIYLRYG